MKTVDILQRAQSPRVGDRFVRGNVTITVERISKHVVFLRFQDGSESSYNLDKYAGNVKIALAVKETKFVPAP